MLGLRKAKFARLPEFRYNEDWEAYAGVAELADALDSKSKKGKFRKRVQKRQT